MREISLGASSKHSHCLAINVLRCITISINKELAINCGKVRACRTRMEFLKLKSLDLAFVKKYICGKGSSGQFAGLIMEIKFRDPENIDRTSESFRPFKCFRDDGGRRLFIESKMLLIPPVSSVNRSSEHLRSQEVS